MLTDARQREYDRLLDGDVSETERDALEASLVSDPEALEWFANRAFLHANLRRSMKRRGIESLSQSTLAHPRTTIWRRLAVSALIAAAIGLLAFLFWPSAETNPAFATLAESHAALWESGDLPTAEGSRLAKGKLRLAEGLATLTFDSGAMVTLEAPATLILIDALTCELVKGTTVSDIPESAIGFRIKTPSADVVDFGTRFAVSVYETGETNTKVIEGHVQVEVADTDEVFELRTGQQNTVGGTQSGQSTDGAGEARTLSHPTASHGPGWTLFTSVKDAYTGRVKGHESDVLLYVKRSVEPRAADRASYMGFAVNGVDSDHIAAAELIVHFEPTGWGLASHISDATFSIYGLSGEAPGWDESVMHGTFPGTPEWVHLGSFTVPQGVQKGPFRVRTEALATFLREQSPNVTIKLVRDTVESETGGLVHGFASRRHPVLPAPTIAILQASPPEESR